MKLDNQLSAGIIQMLARTEQPLEMREKRKESLIKMSPMTQKETACIASGPGRLRKRPFPCNGRGEQQKAEITAWTLA